MKQYDQKKKPPLLFHKFFWFIWLPLSFWGSASVLFSTASEMQSFYWFDILLVVLCTLTMIPTLVCFFGFFGRKPCAWYSVFIYLGQNVILSLFPVVICGIYSPEQLGANIVSLVGMLLFAVLVGIYYLNRKPLFFSDDIHSPEADYYHTTSTEQTGAAVVNTPPSITYCRKCGFELLSGSDFCSKCGTPVSKT